MTDEEIIAAEAAKCGMTITQYRMVRAVPTSLMRDIFNDFRGDRPQSTSMIKHDPTPPVPRGTGWVTPLTAALPPGINIIDRMVEAASAQERAEKLHAQLKQQAEAMEFNEKLEAEQRRRSKELDPVNSGLYGPTTKDE
jgi:hypothetical protein